MCCRTVIETTRSKTFFLKGRKETSATKKEQSLPLHLSFAILSIKGDKSTPITVFSFAIFSVHRPTPHPTSRIDSRRKFLKTGVKAFLMALSITMFRKRDAPGTSTAFELDLRAASSKYSF